jgi:hypothetical protein
MTNADLVQLQVMTHQDLTTCGTADDLYDQQTR